MLAKTGIFTQQTALTLAQRRVLAEVRPSRSRAILILAPFARTGILVARFWPHLGRATVLTSSYMQYINGCGADLVCMQKLNLNTDEFETIVKTAGPGWEGVCSHDGAHLVNGGNLAGLAVFSRSRIFLNTNASRLSPTQLTSKISRTCKETTGRARVSVELGRPLHWTLGRSRANALAWRHNLC